MKEVICLAVGVLLPDVGLGLIMRNLYRVFVRVQLQQQLVGGHNPREQQQQKEGAISGKVFHWSLKNGQIYELFAALVKLWLDKADPG